MNKKFILPIFMILTLSVFVIAHEESEEFTDYQNLDEMLNDLEHINEYLQENQVIVESGLNFLIKNGNISMEVSTQNNSEKNFYVLVNDKTIKRISNGLPEKSSYDLISDEETINEIIQSGNYVEEFSSAYDEGKIRVEANGFVNNIKLFFGKIFLKLFN